MQNQNNEKYEKFFADFKRFKDEADLSKKRGNNDYNPLLIIRSTSDEVGLHSRMLHSFLDVSGEHYQEDLFLKEFLKVAKLEDFFGATKSARVLKESSNIDIRIENGDKFIILENKIYAGDQEAQISRYIDGISKPSKDSQSDEEIAAVPFENIAVIYLAPKKREPSKYSLKEWEISTLADEKILKKDGKSVKLSLLSYEKHILEWIANCQKEVGNITNLNAAFEFYKDAVQRITGKKEHRMSIENFLNTGNEAEIMQKYQIAFDILDNENTIYESYLGLIYKIAKKREGEKWEILKEDERFTKHKNNNKKYRYPIVICNEEYKEQTFKFAICKEENSRNTDYTDYGVRIFVKKGQNYNIISSENDKIDSVVKDLRKRINDKFKFKEKPMNDYDWWFDDKYFYNENINTMLDLVNQVNEFLKNDKEVQELAEKI